MSDLLRTIAFAYRRKGVDAMPGPDLRLLLAYDLRWFAPEDAKRVVQHAQATGLLRDEQGALATTFDAKIVDIPLNFRPTLDVLEETPALPPPRAARPTAAPPATQEAPAAPAAPAPATANPPIAPVPSVAATPAAPASPPAARPSAVDTAVEDERRKRALLIGPDVARLIVRRRAGEDVAEEAAALEAKLLEKEQ